jgi:hypothetical protein
MNSFFYWKLNKKRGVNMISEAIDKMIQDEIKKGISEFNDEFECTKNALEEYRQSYQDVSNKLKEQQKVNKQINEFKTFQERVNENNFETLIDGLNLEEVEIGFRGMDSEEIPTWFRLLCTYYKDKERLFTLMDMFNIKYPAWAKTFKIPFDYDERELDLIFNHMGKMYVCNGQIYSGNMGFYFREQRKYNGDIFKLFINECYVEIPWNLLLMNPLLTTDKYFNKVIESLTKKESNSEYFFKIQNYQELNDDQIIRMAACLPTDKMWDIHKSFIEKSTNLFKLNPDIALRFKNKMNDNHFSTFYYLNYPLKMQIEFVLNESNKYDYGFGYVNKMDISKEEKLELLNQIANKLI